MVGFTPAVVIDYKTETKSKHHPLMQEIFKNRYYGFF